MTNDELLETIAEHFLSVRRIPLQRISIYNKIHRDHYPNADIVHRDVKQKIDGVWTTVTKEFLKVTTVPKHAGWWMCQSLSKAASTIVYWDRRIHHLAPTLKESVQAYLDSLTK